MQENQENTSIQYPKRPEGLTLICVLSFLGGGLSFFSNISIYALYSQLITAIEEDQVVKIPNVDMDMVLDLLQVSGRSYYLIVALVYLVSLYGVYLMWYLRKTGIHYYAVAQIVLLILPLIFIDADISVFPGLIITALFLFLYSRYLKLMS